ncbi:MAG: hypothetical protein J1F35_04700 [Erysipelotrichales bacterium]|nr:hypothetical protein [Erysipelotrichales bacterium]
MAKINYENVLEALIKNYPHDLEAFRKIKDNVTLSIDTIFTNSEWSVDEKIELLNIFEYNPKLLHYTVGTKEEKVSCPIYLLHYADYSALEAVVKHSYDIEESIIDIINYYNKNLKKRAGTRLEDTTDVLINLIESLPIEKRKELFKSYICYKERLVRNNLLYSIIRMHNSRLIKHILPYIDDINLSFPWVVENWDEELVSTYLELGADPLYECNDESLGYTSALETAIAINHYNIFKKLVPYCKDENKLKELLRYSSVIAPDVEIFDNSIVKFMKEKHISNEIKERDENDNNEWRYQSELIENRRLIINDLWDLNNKDDKQDINTIDALIYTFISSNITDFRKYAQIIFDNNIEYRISRLIKAMIYNKTYENKAFYDVFINLFAPRHEKIDLNYEIAKRIIDKKFDIYGHSSYFVDNITHILARVKEENRSKLPIMGYVQNLKTFKYLLKLGYDLHGHVERQDSLFFSTLKKWCYDSDMDTICNYIIDNCDINVSNNEGKSPFEVIIDHFVKVFEPQSHLSLSDQDEIINRMIDVIKRMIKRNGPSVIEDNKEKIDGLIARYIDREYAHLYLDPLKPLFLELASYDIRYEDNTLRAIEFTLKKEYENKDEKEKLSDIDKYIKLYFAHIDSDLELGDLTFNQQYEEILAFIADNEIKEKEVFEELLKKLSEFDITINKAKRFAKAHIPKKRDPEFFKKYMYNTYKVNYYDNLDAYLENIVIAAFGLVKPEDRIAILRHLPHLSVNHYFTEFDTKLPYWYFDEVVYGRDDDDNDITNPGRFEPMRIPVEADTGTLVIDGYLTEYAILTNDLSLMKYLVSRRAKLPIINKDGKDVTLDYVSSEEMEEYINSKAYKSSLGGLHNEEADYLKKILTNPENKQ